MAMLGAKIPIATILGEEREIDVPGGAQPGEVIRVNGSGMPQINGRGRGDLYVHLRVVVPKKLTGEQKDLLKEVASLGGGFAPEAEEGFFERLKRAFGGG